MYDLQTWLSTPSILVLDCSNAGVLVNQQQHRDEDLIILAACSQGAGPPRNLLLNIMKLHASHTSPYLEKRRAVAAHMPALECCHSPPPLVSLAGLPPAASIHARLTSSPAAGEVLPQNPDLPADVFTACLTTPIKMALRWFCTRPSPLLAVDPDLIDRIPGQLNNRKSVLGELNWIFTAITDTIAWNLLPPELFQRLFRQVPPPPLTPRNK